MVPDSHGLWRGEPPADHGGNLKPWAGYAVTRAPGRITAFEESLFESARVCTFIGKVLSFPLRLLFVLRMFLHLKDDLAP